MMWKRKEAPMRDERIEKKSNALAAKLLPVMLVLQAIVLIVKVVLGGWAFCLLDVLGLLMGGVFAAVLLTMKGVWRAQDEAQRELRDGVLSKAFLWMFVVLIVGEFVLFMIDMDNVFWYAPTLVVCFVPSVVFTVRMLREGGLTWGSAKAEKTGKAGLMRSTALGALFFGAVMGWDKCFVDGAFEPAGLLYVLGMAAGWGVLFYLMMTLMLKIGGKQADKLVEQADEDAADE